MRYIITTGGTGGHIFPALALIEEIKNQDREAEILFVGAKNGMEEDICHNLKMPFIALKTSGFIGKGLRSIKALFELFIAYFKAKKIITEFQADMVIGFGGYASAPCILAAKSLNIDIYLHEQNAFPGAVNRYFARFAKKIMLTMPISESILSKEIQEKCILTGNPVRKAIANQCNVEKKDTDKKGLNLLVLGGSLGAHSINEIIITLLDKLCHENINIVHQCGKKDYAYVKNAYEASPYPSSCVMPFIENMLDAYTNADIIIARAGATSLAEFACMQKAVILIPFPYAAHNHQYHNAKSLEEKEACLLIEEKNVYKNAKVYDEKLVFDALSLLNTDKAIKEKLEKNIALFAKPNAANTMYNTIIENK